MKNLAHSQDLRFGYLLAAINCCIKPLKKALYLGVSAIKDHLGTSGKLVFKLSTETPVSEQGLPITHLLDKGVGAT